MKTVEEIIKRLQWLRDHKIKADMSHAKTSRERHRANGQYDLIQNLLEWIKE